MPEPISTFHQVMDIGWFPSIRIDQARHDAAKRVEPVEAIYVCDSGVHIPAFLADCWLLQTSMAYCAASRFARIVS